MTFPTGISTCQVTFGKSFGGAVATEGNITATVQVDRQLIWSATGDTLWPVEETVASGEELPKTVSFRVPHVDQPGFRDTAGDQITGWFYTFTGHINFAGTQITVVKEFQVYVGQTVIDLDTLYDGPPSTPEIVSATRVLSIADLAGVVTHDQLVEAVRTTATTAQLTSAAAAINTTGKIAGKEVWNFDTSRPVWAVGSNPAAVWRYADGSTAHAPA